MGKVVHSMKKGKNVIMNLELDYDEVLQMKGHVEDIHVFSECATNIESHISHRGLNSSTKYFLVPRRLRKELKFNSKVTCQMLNLKNKAVFIYIIDKISQFTPKRDF